MTKLLLDCTRQTLEILIRGYLEVPGMLGTLLGTENLDRSRAVVPVTTPGGGRIDLYVTVVDAMLIEVEPRFNRGQGQQDVEEWVADLLDFLVSEAGSWPPRSEWPEAYWRLSKDQQERLAMVLRFSRDGHTVRIIAAKVPAPERTVKRDRKNLRDWGLLS